MLIATPNRSPTKWDNPTLCLENGDMLEPDADAELEMLNPKPPRGPLTDNQTPGNVTRDRLAAIVSGNEQDPL